MDVCDGGLLALALAIIAGGNLRLIRLTGRGARLEHVSLRGRGALVVFTAIAVPVDSRSGRLILGGV